MQKAAHRTLIMISILIAGFTLSGCGAFKLPDVYKIDIQQGNIINQEMVDQLKPGMTKRQVRFVMGNPIIQDTFQPERWDYYYEMNKANGTQTKERMTVHFDNEKMTHFTGDFVPSGAKTQAAQ